MSFSLSFTTKSRAAAVAKLAKEHVSTAVKAAIETAIVHAPEGIILVEASGHVGDLTYAGSSHQNVTFKVQSITPE